MGMRSSGSCSRTFENVALEGRGRAGRAGWHPQRRVPGAVPQLRSSPHGCSAGRREAGHQLSIEGAPQEADEESRSRDSPFVQERAAENSIDLAAARAVFGRALGMIDEYEEDHPNERGRMAEVTPVFVEVQRAKTFVTAAAVRILDRALAMSGGAGYLSANPLSRSTATRGLGLSCTRWARTWRWSTWAPTRSGCAQPGSNSSRSNRGR